MVGQGFGAPRETAGEVRVQTPSAVTHQAPPHRAVTCQAPTLKRDHVPCRRDGGSGVVARRPLLGAHCVLCVGRAVAEAGSASGGAMAGGSGARGEGRGLGARGSGPGAGVWGPRSGAAADWLVLRFARSPVRALRWLSQLGSAQTLPRPPP